jgi:hypothetical protein
MDYKKFMTPVWHNFERDIIEYFKNHDISTFWNCPQVSRAMILTGGEVAGMYCQSHHLFNYWNITKKRVEDMQSFVEFGGGYGMMCRMARMINKNPYTIIDIPIINQIQKYYLKDTSGVNYISTDKIEATPDCDMFISLYALSECTNACIEYVISRRFFNARHILMCFMKQDNTDFQTTKYIPQFEKFGRVVEMDAEGLYLIK